MNKINTLIIVASEVTECGMFIANPISGKGIKRCIRSAYFELLELRP